MITFNPLGPFFLPLPFFQQHLESKSCGNKKRKTKKVRSPEEKERRKATNQLREQNLAKQLLNHDLMSHNQEDAAKLAHTMRKDPLMFLTIGLMHMVKELKPHEPFSTLIDEEDALTTLLQELQKLRAELAPR